MAIFIHFIISFKKGIGNNMQNIWQHIYAAFIEADRWKLYLKGLGVTLEVSFFAALLGGWDSAMITLIIFMAIDFTTGLIAASMGRSKHSKTGRLSSKAGWLGLAKKFCILLMVVVAVRMDIMIGTTYIRDATCIGFCVNELLSIVENTSLLSISFLYIGISFF